MPKKPIRDEVERTRADINRLEAKESIPAHRKAVAKAETRLKESKIELERALRVARGGK